MKKLYILIIIITLSTILTRLNNSVDLIGFANTNSNTISSTTENIIELSNDIIVYDLIEKGVLMQANYGSILGQYGDKAEIIVRKFFESNMIHFLGSDVHRPNTIYKKIPQALEEIEEIVGKQKLEELTTINPKLALENKRIDIEEPEEARLTFKEKLIMYLKRN